MANVSNTNQIVTLFNIFTISHREDYFKSVFSGVTYYFSVKDSVVYNEADFLQLKIDQPKYKNNNLLLIKN